MSMLRPGALALVTGASSGIGYAIAQQLLAHGVRVIGVARDLERLQREFQPQPHDLLLRSLDVCDGAQVSDFVNALPASWQDIDILVANAGSDRGGRRRFDIGHIEDWVSTIDTNVTGLMRVCHAVIPGMLKRQRGHVVTLGSTSGLSVYEGGTAYAASKHAVHAFTDCLRLDYRDAPLRITEILPGLVRTGFALARNPEDEAGAQAFYDSAKATLDSEHIAAATLFALQQPLEVNVAQILVTPTGNK